MEYKAVLSRPIRGGRLLRFLGRRSDLTLHYSKVPVAGLGRATGIPIAASTA
jgi:hypothetical protein